MKRLLGLLFVSTILISIPLSAQENELGKGKVGLTFPSTGIIWHLSGRVALMPNAGYIYGWADSNLYSATNRSLGVGASLRFYAWEWKGIHLFVSPKYSFNRNSTTSDSAPPTGSPTTSTSVGNGHAITGAWGLQYPISSRVSIYGDYGVSWSRSTSSHSPTTSLSDNSRSSSVRTGGSWGLILYLK